MKEIQLKGFGGFPLYDNQVTRKWILQFREGGHHNQASLNFVHFENWDICVKLERLGF